MATTEDLGVTIEAEYTVGEYDILILSAEESDGLTKWLNQNGYKIPDGAEKVVDSYLKQDMKFFVAKVNLKEQAKVGGEFLRPLQVAFESDKFMLPIRLGTVNAKGDQELFIFMLTQEGRVETANYRTTKIPTGEDIPVYVKDEFGDFYQDMFAEQVRKEGMKTVFLEYAWNMNWCDPCAADPLSQEELRELGVWWQDEPDYGDDIIRPIPMPQVTPGQPQPRIMPPPRRPGKNGTRDAFVTRLHVRYNAETFPEDLKFIQTGDKQNYQGRYVLRHPWTGKDSCEAATQYRKQLPDRFEREAKNLAYLTGRDINAIRETMEQKGQSFTVTTEPIQTNTKKWFEKMWGN